MPQTAHSTEVSVQTRTNAAAPWREATLYCVPTEKETYLEVQPGYFFRIVLRNLSAGRRAVAMWIDGEKVSCECAWMEGLSVLMLEGYPKSARTKFADVIPFKFEELRADGSAARAAPPTSELRGTIKVAVYDVVRTAPQVVAAYVPAAEGDYDEASRAAGLTQKQVMKLGVAAARPKASEVSNERFQVKTEFRLDESSLEMFSFKYRDRAALLLLGIIVSEPETMTAMKAEPSTAKRSRDSAGAEEVGSPAARARRAAVELLDLTDETSDAPPKPIALQKVRVCVNDGKFLTRDVYIRALDGDRGDLSVSASYDWPSLKPFTSEACAALGVDSVMHLWDTDGHALTSLARVLQAPIVVVGLRATETFRATDAHVA